MLATAPADHGAAIHLRLLGSFELTADGRSFFLPPSAQRLVAFLALAQRPVVRSRVAGALWDDRTETRAAACLRSAIWRANSGAPVSLVESGRSSVRLGRHVTVDAQIAADAAHEQIAGRGEPADLAVLGGSLLPGWDDDWVVVERERLWQLCLRAIERMAETQLAGSRIDLAIEAALTVVSCEPLRESAHRILIDAHLRAGNRVEALRQFERCRRLLHDELALPPSEMLLAAIAPAQHEHSPGRSGPRVGTRPLDLQLR